MNDAIPVMRKPVWNVMNLSFEIPEYQRRYRWKPLQVLQLLEDITQFSLESGSDTFYSLQPLVVKKKDSSDDVFTVIDGQQRLTTIMMIMHSLNERYVDEFRIQFKELTNIKEQEIDKWHKQKAKHVITHWIEKNKKILNRFEQVFLYQTQFIWYELTPEVDEIEIFLRLNVGKIPLTREERIKAFFLRDAGDNLETREVQHIIAHEWNFLENALQNESLWGFLNPGRGYENRIGLLFDLAVPGELAYDHFRDLLLGGKENRKYVTLDKRILLGAWTSVKQVYEQLYYWYTNFETYHYIGYLNAVKNHGSVQLLQELLVATSSWNKSLFEDRLHERISMTIRASKEELLQEDVYERLGSSCLVPVLLLFNVESIVKTQHKDERFDFYHFNNQSWDVEHIRSQADYNETDDPTALKNLAKNIVSYFGETDIGLSEDEKELYHAAFELTKLESSSKILPARLGELIPKHMELLDLTPQKHGLGNVALLNPDINRGYKDAFFGLKRKIILENAKTGRFIPLCTRLVFQKAYSLRPMNLLEWTNEDANMYRNHIIETIKEFLK
ncbi:MAG: DUF262 domain-containing protein [Clostridia bacterium]|nr:DUF262 domain-containing protein [Clostridia bacterium]